MELTVYLSEFRCYSHIICKSVGITKSVRTFLKSVLKVDKLDKFVHTVYIFYSINHYNAGIDLSRQNLTSVHVRFYRLKSIPAL